jgi:glycosyltransferase involved in cell wall biosynthesis
MNALRILHVTGGLNLGGTETWLLNVCRHIDRQRFKFDFLVHSDTEGAYDDEVRHFGCRIINCGSHYRLISYIRRFRQILATYGPYDIVHSHVHDFSGVAMWTAHTSAVRTRIVHSHSDTSIARRRASLVRRSYLRLMRSLNYRYATHGLAASTVAGSALFGSQWQRDSRWRILRCGIDLDRFRTPEPAARVRADLCIPANAYVIGHVGRFVPVKNHRFVLDIAAAVMKREQSAWLLLIGEGPLMADVKVRVAELGIQERVVFAGRSKDVSAMMSAMDVLVLPSFYEGLPLTLLESQAAGLPAIVSHVVSPDGDVAKELIIRCSLSESSDSWAESCLRARGIDEQRRRSGLSLVEASEFNIRSSVACLEDIYLCAHAVRPAES